MTSFATAQVGDLVPAVDIVRAGGWKEPTPGAAFAGGVVEAVDREQQRVRLTNGSWHRFDPRTGAAR